MPIIQWQYEAELEQSDGTKVPIEPRVALIRQGPVVQITFGLAQTLASQLTSQGHVLPTPIGGYGLIDTGATVTCIDDALAQQMGLPVIDVVQMASASHPSTPANVYPIQLQIVGSPIRAEIPRAMGTNLATQGIVALIGRDFLQSCTLFYNGFSGQITLAI